MAATRITWNAAEGRLVLHTPYSAAFVQELKAAVPSDGRRWNPDAKTWAVALERVGPAVVLLLRYFGEVEIAEDLPSAVVWSMQHFLDGHISQIQAELEGRSMADKSAAPIIYAWGFPSRSAGPSATSYEVILRDSGALSCNCPGWVFNKMRNCAHVKVVRELRDFREGSPYTLWTTAILQTPALWGGSQWTGTQESRPTAGPPPAKAPTQAARRKLFTDEDIARGSEL